MTKVTPTSSRKLDHIRINVEEDVKSGLTTGLENYRFKHRALPEVNLKEVNIGLEIFGKKLSAPILISSMTGGAGELEQINHNLAAAAQTTGIAMGLGSQRAAIENQDLSFTYQVRSIAPDILLFANLGAVQLNYGYGVDECFRAVEMIEADALILHFNALQEAVQREGDTNFKGLLKRIEEVCKNLPVPVIVKEVGWGFSKRDARLLAEVGVAAIDVAGAGGTSWTQVEMYRSKSNSQSRLAASFIDWGIPTAEAIINVREAAPDMLIFASGGLKNGIDIAKCIALGASLGGMAGIFLKRALNSINETVDEINAIKNEIKVCMFACGVSQLGDLRSNTLVEKH